MATVKSHVRDDNDDAPFRPAGPGAMIAPPRLQARLWDGDAAKPPVPRPWQVVANERAIIGVLEGARRPGETIAAHYQRIEHALGALFATLAIGEARELQRRLSTPVADDMLAKLFARLVVERRLRLIAFLAEAPRRAARCGGRK